MMVLSVSLEAQANYAKLLERVFNRFGVEATLRLEAEIGFVYTQICQLPFMYPAVKMKQGAVVRKAVAHANAIVAYKVDELLGAITVIDIFDSLTDWK